MEYIYANGINLQARGCRMEKERRKGKERRTSKDRRLEGHTVMAPDQRDSSGRRKIKDRRKAPAPSKEPS